MPGKIIVKQDGHEPTSKGGIVFTEKFQNKDRPMTGLVLAVGPGKLCELSDLEIGNRVVAAVGESGIGKLLSTITTQVVADIRKLERQSRPVSVKAGDRVIFRVFAGDGIEWTDGSMCRCVTEDDLLAVIVE